MQELVVESLVVSLAMVVFYVLVDETTQMPLAERDHACETLLCDRPDEPLGIGVEIGTLRRQPNRLNTGALQDLAKDPRIEGIAVVNQMARPAQTAIDRVGQIAGLLLVRRGMTHSRSVRGSTTSHHAIAAGRRKARGWCLPYFSQPILEGDRSLFSPVPSPLVPRQWAQSANSLGNWRARPVFAFASKFVSYTGRTSTKV